jgi:AcrR family transcriptional regulator
MVEQAAAEGQREDPQRSTSADRSAFSGRVTAFLWNELPQGRRGPKPKFTVEQIADAGIAIADENGLDAVTMQRIAERLGATKMALYRYVPGRPELDAFMLERALGAPVAARRAEWRSALTQWAMDVHERGTAHPWAVELVQRPHVPGPRELEWFEAGLSAMKHLPLRGAEKLDVLALLVGHVMSIVRQKAGGPTPEDEMARVLGPVLAARADEFPFTAAAFAHPDEGTRDGALRFGLERVIAGVEALAAARSRA